MRCSARRRDWAVGRFQDAIYRHQEAADSFWKIGDRYGQATALNDLGNAYRPSARDLGLGRQQAGDVDGARQAFQQAIYTFASINAED